MTPEEIQKDKDYIDSMSQESMAYLRRFAPAGHPYFNTTLPLSDYFKKKFEEKGGMTPEISKSMGW